MSVKESATALCELCNVALLNEQSKESHLLGKKHQLALHREHMNKLKENCGIFVSGFPNLIKHEEILSYFGAFGKITDHYFGEGNRYAIIQFSEPDPVDKLLKTNVILRGRKLQVKRRILKGRGPDQPEVLQPNENFDEINESLKTAPDFQSQVQMLIHQMQPNWHEMVNKYKSLCYDLQNVLQDIFPNCVVHPFGSTVTRLGFTTSDVDIYVEVFNVNSAESSNIPQFSRAATFVNKSKKLLQQYGRIFSQVRAIPRAKTPIVKCIHNPTNISCDFNFKNMLGVCNSFLIRYYLSLDNKLTALMIIIKYWAKVHELSGSSGKFSNYALIMLVVFYLQQSPYLLPPVITLQRSPNCINLQENWNGAFEHLDNFVSDPLANHTLPELLHGCFDYYSNLDFTLNIICPYLGHTVPKTDFLKPELLPSTFDRYKTNITEQQPLRLETPICVQDPFEHNHNITSSVPAKLLEEFVGLCKVGADVFKNLPVDNLALYRLLTDEAESIDFKKYIGTDSTCRFKIPMGNYLVYLNNIITSSGEVQLDADEKLVKLRAAWYDRVNYFIITVLKEIMKFTVTVKKDSSDSKAQRLNGQTDVHDTDVVDSVSFHCSGKRNLWETRKAIIKEINIDESLPLLDKQISLTNYMMGLYKKPENDDAIQNDIIEFDMTMQAKIIPTEMTFHLTKLNSSKRCFKSFAVFIAKNIPVWFERHIAELDKSIQCETEAAIVAEDSAENLNDD